MRVGVINYRLCNIDSICRALSLCGGEVDVISDVADLEASSRDRLVIPGVGAFPAAMEYLRNHGLTDAIHEHASAGVPILGICLGMQLLARTGTEFGLVDGLNLVQGDVVRLSGEGGQRVPHIGWNTVHFDPECPLYRGIIQDSDFYFVHSYHFRTDEADQAAAVTPYGGNITTSIWSDRIYGVQFHPEKSQQVGFALLRNFLSPAVEC